MSEKYNLIRSYIFGVLGKEGTDKEHLDAAMRWQCFAQDIRGKGISAAYFLKTGWYVDYPETSGYAIATFLEYAKHSKDADFIRRAIQIGDWEISIQAADGGVISNELMPRTRVFNTGMVLLGWCALYESSRVQKYLDAAVRAGNYLVENQDSDGAWRKNTHCGARTYHARVDWGLLRLAGLTSNDKYAEAARRNLEWVLAQQLDNGWFSNCGFDNVDPITHVIAYTIRGLIESSTFQYPMVRSLPLLPSAVKAADALCDAIRKYPVRNIPGMVPASFTKEWDSQDIDSCLTGNAQLAICLYRLFHFTGNQKYQQVAETIITATKKTQNISTSFQPVFGAISGSYPMYRGYSANCYPNWATKFFADALLMKINLAEKLSIHA